MEVKCRETFFKSFNWLVRKTSSLHWLNILIVDGLLQKALAGDCFLPNHTKQLYQIMSRATVFLFHRSANHFHLANMSTQAHRPAASHQQSERAASCLSWATSHTRYRKQLTIQSQNLSSNSLLPKNIYLT